MKNVEAIYYLEQLKNSYTPLLTEEKAAIDMAISALEKQEGKKPINVRLADGRLGDNGIKSGECPSCGREVDGNLLGIYCGSCGQKLDWSEAYGADDMEEG